MFLTEKMDACYCAKNDGVSAIKFLIVAWQPHVLRTNFLHYFFIR